MAFKFYKAPLVSLNLPVEPFGKQRARVTKVGGFARAYTPKKTLDAENLIQAYVREQLKGFEPYKGAIHMKLDAYIVPPKSWSKRRTEEAMVGMVHPTSKPDTSNILKLVEDALNGIVYVDDSQIVSVEAAKHYAEKPAIELRFYKFYAYDETVGNDHE